MGTRDADRKPDGEIEELLADAYELEKRTQRLSKGELSDSSVTGILSDIRDDVGFLRRIVYSAVQGILSLYRKILAPVWRTISPPVFWLVRSYARLWDWVTYRTDRATGARSLSKVRAGVMVAITLAAVAAATPTRVGNAVRFITLEPLMDAAWMAVSLRTETFYLNHSEEIDPAGNVHSVRGCKSEGKCSEKDAAYFRIKPRLAHDIWKFLHQGNPIYVPDHVVAPIAPGVNRCEVTYYGYRVTASWISRLMRSLEIYPIMLEATCTHLDSQTDHARE